MHYKLLVLQGDGIGPEIVNEALKIINLLRLEYDVDITFEEALIGGSAYDDCGNSLPHGTMQLAQDADAILLGAVGGPRWEHLDIENRPEKALLDLRMQLHLFANLRPVKCYASLENSSPLKNERVAGLDMLIVRELTGGIYFGQPSGKRTTVNGEREGFDTMIYTEREVERIGHLAFKMALDRDRRIISVDKANVLSSSELWRDVISKVARHYPEVTLRHMYVDNAAMQLVCHPRQFDVIVTSNLFGDILSDCAAVASGSLGMLPSASLNAYGKGLYEPIHGSAPDIAGTQTANPLGTILSVALMLRHSFKNEALAKRVEQAVFQTINEGYRTNDILSTGFKKMSTAEMGDAVVRALQPR